MLHLLAIAREAGVDLDLETFDRISASVPIIADLKPGGRFVATDLHRAGGTALIARRLLDLKALHGDAMTVTGKRFEKKRPRRRRRPARKSFDRSARRSRRPVAW